MEQESISHQVMETTQEVMPVERSLNHVVALQKEETIANTEEWSLKLSSIQNEEGVKGTDQECDVDLSVSNVLESRREVECLKIRGVTSHVPFSESGLKCCVPATSSIEHSVPAVLEDMDFFTNSGKARVDTENLVNTLQHGENEIASPNRKGYLVSEQDKIHYEITHENKMQVSAECGDVATESLKHHKDLEAWVCRAASDTPSEFHADAGKHGKNASKFDEVVKDISSKDCDVFQTIAEDSLEVINFVCEKTEPEDSTVPHEETMEGQNVVPRSDTDVAKDIAGCVECKAEAFPLLKAEFLEVGCYQTAVVCETNIFNESVVPPNADSSPVDDCGQISSTNKCSDESVRTASEAHQIEGQHSDLDTESQFAEVVLPSELENTSETKCVGHQEKMDGTEDPSDKSSEMIKIPLSECKLPNLTFITHEFSVPEEIKLNMVYVRGMERSSSSGESKCNESGVSVCIQNSIVEFEKRLECKENMDQENQVDVDNGHVQRSKVHVALKHEGSGGDDTSKCQSCDIECKINKDGILAEKHCHEFKCGGKVETVQSSSTSQVPVSSDNGNGKKRKCIQKKVKKRRRIFTFKRKSKSPKNQLPKSKDSSGSGVEPHKSEVFSSVKNDGIKTNCDMVITDAKHYEECDAGQQNGSENELQFGQKNEMSLKDEPTESVRFCGTEIIAENPGVEHVEFHSEEVAANAKLYHQEECDEAEQQIACESKLQLMKLKISCELENSNGEGNLETDVSDLDNVEGQCNTILSGSVPLPRKHLEDTKTAIADQKVNVKPTCVRKKQRICPDVELRNSSEDSRSSIPNFQESGSHDSRYQTCSSVNFCKMEVPVVDVSNPEGVDDISFQPCETFAPLECEIDSTNKLDLHKASESSKDNQDTVMQIKSQEGVTSVWNEYSDTSCSESQKQSEAEESDVNCETVFNIEMSELQLDQVVGLTWEEKQILNEWPEEPVLTKPLDQNLIPCVKQETLDVRQMPLGSSVHRDDRKDVDLRKTQKVQLRHRSMEAGDDQENTLNAQFDRLLASASTASSQFTYQKGSSNKSESLKISPVRYEKKYYSPYSFSRVPELRQKLKVETSVNLQNQVQNKPSSFDFAHYKMDDLPKKTVYEVGCSHKKTEHQKKRVFPVPLNVKKKAVQLQKNLVSLDRKISEARKSLSHFITEVDPPESNRLYTPLELQKRERESGFWPRSKVTKDEDFREDQNCEFKVDLKTEVDTASNEQVPSENRRPSKGVLVPERYDLQRKTENGGLLEESSNFSLTKSLTDVKSTVPCSRDLENTEVPGTLKKEAGNMEQEAGSIKKVKVNRCLLGNLTLILPDESINCGSNASRNDPQDAQCTTKSGCEPTGYFQNKVQKWSRKEEGEITPEPQSCEANKLTLRKGSSKVQLKHSNPGTEEMAEHGNKLNARFNYLVRNAAYHSAPKYNSTLNYVKPKYQLQHYNQSGSFNATPKYEVSRYQKCEKLYPHAWGPAEQYVSFAETKFKKPPCSYDNPINRGMRTQVESRSQEPGENNRDASCGNGEYDNSLCCLSDADDCRSSTKRKAEDTGRREIDTQTESDFLDRQIACSEKSSHHESVDFKLCSQKRTKTKDCEETEPCAKFSSCDRQQKFKPLYCLQYSANYEAEKDTEIELKKQGRHHQRNKERHEAQNLVKRQLSVISSHVGGRERRDYHHKRLACASGPEVSKKQIQGYFQESGTQYHNSSSKEDLMSLKTSLSDIFALERVEAFLDKLQDEASEEGSVAHSPLQGNTSAEMLLNYGSAGQGSRKTSAVPDSPLKIKRKHKEKECHKRTWSRHNKGMQKHFADGKTFSPKLTPCSGQKGRYSSDQLYGDKHKNRDNLGEECLSRHQVLSDSPKRSSSHNWSVARSDKKHDVGISSYDAGQSWRSRDKGTALRAGKQEIGNGQKFLKRQLHGAENSVDVCSEKDLKLAEVVNPSMDTSRLQRCKSRRSHDTSCTPNEHVRGEMKKSKSGKKRHEFHPADYLKALNSSGITLTPKPQSGVSAARKSSEFQGVGNSSQLSNQGQQAAVKVHSVGLDGEEEDADIQKRNVDDSLGLLQNYLSFFSS